MISVAAAQITAVQGSYWDAARQWPSALQDAGTGALALALAILALVLSVLAFAGMAGHLRYRNRRKAQEWLVRETRWERPLLDVLSGAEAPAAIWSLVAKEDELYFLDYLLRHARRVRGSTRDVLAELARPYIGRVAERMTGGDAERRARAVETVAYLGFGPYAGRVLDALDDPSPLVTMIAIRSIAKHQRPEHVHLLIERAARLSDWNPRQLTAILASMGAEAVPALRVAMVDTGLPPAFRAAAADALRQLHDAGAIDAAIIVLSSATDRDLLAAALRLVTELGGAQDAGLVRPLCAHRDPVIRTAAIQALNATGGPGDRDLVRRGMKDDSRWVAIGSARALRRSGEIESLRTLAEAEDPRSLLARQVLLESA